MPLRRIVFGVGEFYHVLNRGVARLPIYNMNKEYTRFLNLLDFYRYDSGIVSFSHFRRLSSEDQVNFIIKTRKVEMPLIEVLAYCLMPNHFHLVLKQMSEGGIQEFMSNVQNGYVKYLNKRSNRKGPLFESVFKAIHIETDEQLLHTTRYVHLNLSTTYLIEAAKLDDYKWSSLSEYLRDINGFCSTEMVLEMVGGSKNYKQFVLDQADYQKQLNKIRHLALEEV